MIRKCKDCEWWDFQCIEDGTAGHREYGYCKRRAPVPWLIKGEPNHARSQHNTVWAWTDDDDWCGEFKNKHPYNDPTTSNMMADCSGKPDCTCERCV